MEVQYLISACRHNRPGVCFYKLPCASFCACRLLRHTISMYLSTFSWNACRHMNAGYPCRNIAHFLLHWFMPACVYSITLRYSLRHISLKLPAGIYMPIFLFRHISLVLFYCLYLQDLKEYIGDVPTGTIFQKCLQANQQIMLFLENFSLIPVFWIIQAYRVLAGTFCPKSTCAGTSPFCAAMRGVRVVVKNFFLQIYCRAVLLWK